MPSPEPNRGPAAPMLRRFGALRDYTIGAIDGDVGTIDDLYFDDLSWTVRYVVADTGAWLSGRKVLLSPVSMLGFDAASGRVDTELTRRQVQDSPSIDTAKPVARQQETALQAYYGYAPYWAGPYRWGRVAYPYALMQAGVLSLATQPPYDDQTADESAAREREHHDKHLRSARAVTGYAIRAIDGEIGHVEDFLLDEHDWAIRYLIVDPRSWWPGAYVLIASDWVRAVDWNDAVVQVDVTREAVRGARRYEPSGRFGRDEETQFYAQHRRPGYWARGPEAWRSHPPAA